MVGDSRAVARSLVYVSALGWLLTVIGVRKDDHHIGVVFAHAGFGVGVGATSALLLLTLAVEDRSRRHYGARCLRFAAGLGLATWAWAAATIFFGEGDFSFIGYGGVDPKYESTVWHVVAPAGWAELVLLLVAWAIRDLTSRPEEHRPEVPPKHLMQP